MIHVSVWNKRLTNSSHVNTHENKDESSIRERLCLTVVYTYITSSIHTYLFRVIHMGVWHLQTPVTPPCQLTTTDRLSDVFYGAPQVQYPSRLDREDQRCLHKGEIVYWCHWQSTRPVCTQYTDPSIHFPPANQQHFKRARGLSPLYTPRPECT